MSMAILRRSGHSNPLPVRSRALRVVPLFCRRGPGWLETSQAAGTKRPSRPHRRLFFRQVEKVTEDSGHVLPPFWKGAVRQPIDTTAIRFPRTTIAASAGSDAKIVGVGNSSLDWRVFPNSEGEVLASPRGLEPLTCGLGNHRSILLSYGDAVS